jgi:hypothetical protein
MYLPQVSHSCICCLVSDSQYLVELAKLHQKMLKEAGFTRRTVNGGRQDRADVHGVVFCVKAERKAVSRLVGPADLPMKTPLHQPKVLEGG